MRWKGILYTSPTRRSYYSGCCCWLSFSYSLLWLCTLKCSKSNSKYIEADILRIRMLKIKTLITISHYLDVAHVYSNQIFEITIFYLDLQIPAGDGFEKKKLSNEKSKIQNSKKIIVLRVWIRMIWPAQHKFEVGHFIRIIR